MHPRAPRLLEDICSAADFVETSTYGLELSQFKQDWLLRQAVERNVEIIGDSHKRVGMDRFCGAGAHDLPSPGNWQRG